MFTVGNSFIRRGDELLQVIDTFRESEVEDFEVIKQSLGADTVLRRQEFLYFCSIVPELEFEMVTEPEIVAESHMSGSIE
jgi:hypothetical protein